MCVPGPPLFLLPALRELKGSRDLLQGGDIWPYIPDVGFRELRNARAWHLPWQKVPKYLHGKCLQRRTTYRWRQASLCQRGWGQSGWRRGGCCGGIPNEQEAPQDSSCPRSPTGRRRDQRRRPRFTKAVPLLPHTRSGIELLQTAHDKKD